jgi:cation-transporting ATPase I
MDQMDEAKKAAHRRARAVYRRVIEQTCAARAASHRSAMLALAGSAAGILLVVGGPARRAARRALVAVNGAALFSIIAATWSAAALARRPDPVPNDGTSWHVLPPAVALERLNSGSDGLSTEEAQQRMAERATWNGNEPKQPGLARASVQELANPLTPALSRRRAPRRSAGPSWTPP